MPRFERCSAGRSMLLPLAALLCTSLFALPSSAERVCLSHPWTGAQVENAGTAALIALAQWVEPTLDGAPSMRSALRVSQPDLCLDPELFGARGYLEVEERQILIDANVSAGLQRGILLHELRHLDQLARGFCPNNMLSLSENARATIATEADASATSLVLAWQLRADGDPLAWNALAAWETQADIAQRFEDEIRAGADVPVAAAAAFAQWYESPDRRDSYHLASCSDYLDREDRGHLLRGREALPDDFFDRLCVLPDGRPYPCVEPPLSAR